MMAKSSYTTEELRRKKRLEQKKKEEVTPKNPFKRTIEPKEEDETESK